MPDVAHSEAGYFGSERHWQGGPPPESRGTAGGLGATLPEACRKCHEAEKTTCRERKKYRLTLYNNIIIIIISSNHRFMFPAIFVLKYKTPTTSGCGATSAVQSAVF